MQIVEGGIRDIVANYHVATLEGGQFTEAEFTTYMKFSSISQLAIRGAAFAPVVTGAGRSQWESQHNLTIHNDNTTDVPAPDRDFYLPLLYRYFLSPADAQLVSATMGYDILSLWPFLVGSSLVSGLPSLSAATSFATKDGPVPGLVYMSPIFVNATARDALDSSPFLFDASAFRNVVGFMYATIASAQFFPTYLTPDASDLNYAFRVLDTGSGRNFGTPELFSTWNDSWPGAYIAQYAINATIVVTNRTWTLECTPTKSLVNERITSVPIKTIVVTVAVIFGVVLVLVAAMLIRRAYRFGRKAQNALQALFSDSESIVRAIPDPLLALDDDDQVVGANQLALDATGYSAGDIGDLKLQQLIQGYGDKLGTGKRGAGDQLFKVVRKNGSSFPVEISMSPRGRKSGSDQSPSAAGSSVFSRVLVFRDITEKYERENALVEARMYAEAADKRTESVLRYLCHELRNPLHVVIGYTQLVLNRHSDATIPSDGGMSSGNLPSIFVSATDRDELKEVMEASRYISSLIEDVLTFVDLSRNETQSPDRSFDMTSLLSLVSQRPGFEVSIDWYGHRKFIGKEERVTEALAKVLDYLVFIRPDNGVLALEGRSSTLRGGYELVEVSLESRSKTHGIDVFDKTEFFDSPLLAELKREPFAENGSSRGKKFGAPGIWLSVARVIVERCNGSFSILQSDSGRIRAILKFTFKRSNSADRILRHSCDLGLMLGSDLGRRPPLDALEMSSILLRPSLELAVICHSSSTSKTLPTEDETPTSDPVRDPVRNSGDGDLEHLSENIPELPSVNQTPTRNDGVIATPTLDSPAALIASGTSQSGTFDAITIVSTRPDSGPLKQRSSETDTIILVVEDNGLVAKLTQRMLKRGGFKSEIATDGVVCVDMVRNIGIEGISLVLMDLQMPRLDGFGAARHLRSDLHFAGPIVALTAFTTNNDVEQCLEGSLMQEVLGKPVTEAKLLETVRKFIGWRLHNPP
ncbi:hypothetical protein M427DRAFT_285950 [Gonapodya prolifera JEL478]|uniref:Uncharacterized protein n=1 Tax=Gonapodya prolifera (strain JEL478) TaxID=1344416 RepID=A0A139AJ70_GONPJ|nr:hypothetical protein M427DRAFT_285950 [Gonapodya prolifera JEL478]|eukprot:KXS16836.1 hypothetical protein M427DRAFT_285950 [Gonapodya prolifera JEL478]